MVLQRSGTRRMAMLRGYGTRAYAFFPLDQGEQTGDHVYAWTQDVGALGDLDPSSPGMEFAIQR